MVKLGYEPAKVSRVVTEWRDEVKGKTTRRVASAWDEVAWEFELPATCFRLPRPKPKRTFTDEQRAAAAARMKQGRLGV